VVSKEKDASLVVQNIDLKKYKTYKLDQKVLKTLPFKI
jgi:hypothetical protein